MSESTLKNLSMMNEGTAVMMQAVANQGEKGQ
jgi:hypothetical protein